MAGKQEGGAHALPWEVTGHGSEHRTPLHCEDSPGCGADASSQQPPVLALLAAQAPTGPQTPRQSGQISLGSPEVDTTMFWGLQRQ